MVTKENTAQVAAVKTAKIKKEPVALAVRLIEQMKRGAMTSKLSADDLDRISSMSNALKTFMTNGA